jgi:hypothetical protein
MGRAESQVPCEGAKVTVESVRWRSVRLSDAKKLNKVAWSVAISSLSSSTLGYGV